jgi:phage gp29-like protein
MIAELSNRLSNLFTAKKGVNGASIGRRVITPNNRDRMDSNSLGSKQSPANVIAILRTALNGDIRQQYQVYELMEDSWARLAKNLHELKSAAAAATYTVMPFTERGERPTDSAQEKADFVQYAIDEWVGNPIEGTNGFRNAIYDLCDGVGKGFSVQEILWEAKPEGICPKSTYFCHPRYYSFPYDKPDLMLSPQGDGVYEEFPQNKFLIGIYKNRSGNSMGYGLLRQLAYWWSGQNFCRDWLLNFAQVFGQPLRWATYDPGAAANIKNDIADMLENMGSAAWGAFPAGTQVEFKEAGKTGQDNPQSYFIQLADKLCDITILGQTLTTDVGDSGSRALGDVHEEVRRTRLQDVCEWAADVLNEQLVSFMCELNYGNKFEMPKLVPDLAGPADPTLEAQRDQILLGSGVEMPREWFYDRHDVPIPQAGEEIITAPEPPPMPGPMFGKDGVVEAAERAEPGPRDKLLNRVIEDVTGVSSEWLAPVKPAFVQLVNKAMDESVSDEDFLRAITKASNTMPELFDDLDTKTLQDAMERNMGAAMVNGAVKRFEASPDAKLEEAPI